MFFAVYFEISAILIHCVIWCFVHDLQNKNFKINVCFSVGPCDHDPCRNDGKCEVVGGDYNCSCINHYSGRNCEGKVLIVFKRVKTHQLLQVCKQVVTNLFTSCQQVVFTLLVPMWLQQI